MDIAVAHTSVYGEPPDGVYRAPGRVNLIGEHTDYNDGFVLPMPIGRFLEVSIRRREDEMVRLHSVDYDESSEYNMSRFKKDPDHHWANYVLGVVYALQLREHSLGGFDMCITGDVPIGAGLSSSAALETAVVRALWDQFKLELTPVEAAYVGKECENNFVGVQSGIMDQFVSSIGEQGKALFIDCRSNQHSLHKIRDDTRVVIVNSIMDRSLTGSEYNIRYSQCQKAVKVIKQDYHQVKALRDVTEEMLEDQWGRLPELIARRARHVVTENNRVLEAIKYLDAGDMSGFGELMYESHDSLRSDYEVSSKNLDHLVEYSADIEGVLGARLTGAGFGGCTVNLVEADYVEEFSRILSERYFCTTGKNCDIYVA